MTNGTAHGHAGEILQGAVERDGQVQRLLVTLPTPELRSTAVFHPRCEGGLRVYPAWKQKSLRAAALTLKTLGCSGQNGVIELSSEIPVCRGLGSSTSDCVAVIRAVAAHCHVACGPEAIAQIAHQAEQSSDSTMFEEQVVVFLHRQGVVLEELGGPLPKMRMLIVEPRESADRVCTDTLRRPRYDAEHIELFDRLLCRLRPAIGENDAAAVGWVASASAEVNQRFLPKPHYDAVVSVGAQTRALGVAAAHSGTVLTLLYEENADAQIAEARSLLAASSLEQVRALCTWTDAAE
jgi:uncharacterized protein involved in propanediol utilization